MKKCLLWLLVSFSTLGLWAAQVPTLLVVSTTNESVQIPIASIQKITYDQEGLATMYVITNQGTQTYALSDVQRMTLANVPAYTDLPEIQEHQASEAQKILINGMVYILKDGRLYTLSGN